MIKQRTAIGIENYKEIISKSYYYVDKTLLIKELLDKGSKVNLFTRPRRFGKTLALSMIKTFFEAEIDVYGETIDNSEYFEGMKIEKAGEEYLAHRGQYPVISLSLKSAKQPNFEMAYKSLLGEIIKEYERHRYVLLGKALLDKNKDKYNDIMNGKAEKIDYAKSLEFLSDCLKTYHKKNTIILIDEYDVPLENAHFEGFYNEMITFIRSLFESALKTNESLEFAMVTGCLRITEEAPSSLGSKRPHQVNEVGFPTKLEKTSLSSQCQSIFTGLNNLRIVSILNQNYAEYFGFTQEEVAQMLMYYGMENRKEQVKDWYDGYLFGEVEVYNPWSVINYVADARENQNYLPKPYWSNTSSNSIVRELVQRADNQAKQEIELLIHGKTIEKPIHEDITYDEVYKTQDNLWNFLYFTGYLKKEKERQEEETILLTMKIPNREIRYIFSNIIRDWFTEKVSQVNRAPLHQAILAGDCEAMELILRRYLMEGISYYDNVESFYHGYMIGLLQGVPDYIMRSNREAGNGRPDIQLVPFDLKKTAIIIEIKKTEKLEEMENKCQEALIQIEEQQYDAELKLEGYKEFRKYGICFCKKSCRVKLLPCI